MDHAVGILPATPVPPLVVPLDPIPDPLALLERVAARPYPALLDGASHQGDLGRWSYLAWDPVTTVVAGPEAWPAVERQLRGTTGAPPAPDGAPPFAGGWIGWFGYELGRAFDRQPVPRTDDLATPAISLALYDTVVAWDHSTGRAWLVSTGIDATGAADPHRAAARHALRTQEMAGGGSVAVAMPAHEPVRVAGEVSITAFAPAPEGLRGDFSAAAYPVAVQRIVDDIHAGDLFQANLSQRFVAPWPGSALALYRNMRAETPAALGAYLDHGRHVALSASPELFLRYDRSSGRVETRPIKGTRPRGQCPAEDAQLATELVASPKDRAENVMIVDLLRNDLARVALPGTVDVPTLAALETHPAVHHLVSVVTAQLAPGQDGLDLLRATFPGGSVTGAPKLRAMEEIAELEPVARGIYCGAIGWLGLDGSLMLNVAIRTVTVAGGIAAVHAGGGITALSDPEAEYRETLDKARGLITALARRP